MRRMRALSYVFYLRVQRNEEKNMNSKTNLGNRSSSSSSSSYSSSSVVVVVIEQAVVQVVPSSGRLSTALLESEP